MKVIAVDISLGYIEAYETEAAAVAKCPGLAIAEGDWLFFDGEGNPLQAVFSKAPYVDTFKRKYGNGEYRLVPGYGQTLQQWLFERCKKEDFWFGTLEDFERRFT